MSSEFEITRTVDNASPAVGDVVEIETVVDRKTLGHLLYRVRDFTPACFEYVPGSAEWQAYNGEVANEESMPNEFSVTEEYVQFSHVGGVTAEPFWMTAEYKVTCEVGEVNTGGTWIKRALRSERRARPPRSIQWQ